MKCTNQFRVLLFLLKKYAEEGRFRYVQYQEIYKELCKDAEDKANCRASLRMAINALVKAGLLRKHSRGRGKREVKPAGWVEEMLKEIDMIYRYGNTY